MTGPLLDTEDSFDAFVAALTGADLQSSAATGDLAAAVRIADAGATLKARLLSLRAEALENAISDDPISAASTAVWNLTRYLPSGRGPG